MVCLIPRNTLWPLLVLNPSLFIYLLFLHSLWRLVGCMTYCSSVYSPKKRLNRSGKRVIHKVCLTEGARIKSLFFVGLWIEGGGGKKGLYLFYSSLIFKNEWKILLFSEEDPFVSPYCSFEPKLCHENFIYELPL